MISSHLLSILNYKQYDDLVGKSQMPCIVLFTMVTEQLHQPHEFARGNDNNSTIRSPWKQQTQWGYWWMHEQHVHQHQVLSSGRGLEATTRRSLSWLPRFPTAQSIQIYSQSMIFSDVFWIYVTLIFVRLVELYLKGLLHVSPDKYFLIREFIGPCYS